MPVSENTMCSFHYACQQFFMLVRFTNKTTGIEYYFEIIDYG